MMFRHSNPYKIFMRRTPGFRIFQASKRRRCHFQKLKPAGEALN